MKRYLGIVAIVTLVLLSGCARTPLQKLASNHVYPELNGAFWGAQQDAKTPLWQEAVQYCQAHADKPNCDAVMQLFVITNGSTTVPTYGASGNSLSAPDS